MYSFILLYMLAQTSKKHWKKKNYITNNHALSSAE